MPIEVDVYRVRVQGDLVAGIETGARYEAVLNGSSSFFDVIKEGHQVYTASSAGMFHIVGMDVKQPITVWKTSVTGFKTSSDAIVSRLIKACYELALGCEVSVRFPEERKK